MINEGKYKALGIINSGSFGCVFHPSLECGSTKPSSNLISKLMKYDEAAEEYSISIKLKEVFGVILPNYKKYIILDESICNVKKISLQDLEGFEKCHLFKMLNIQKKNVNDELDRLLIVNQRYGGKEFQYYFNKNTFGKILLNFVDNIKNCILVLNKNGIYHTDLKSNNILVSKNKSYIIDWGGAVLNPTIENYRGSNNFSWNAPFGYIIFGPNFGKNCNLNDINNVSECVKTFMEDYEKYTREFGHYKFIKTIILFFNLNPNCIEEYLIKILTNYSKEEYFKIFLHNVDLWGCVMCLVDFFMTTNNKEAIKYGRDLISYLYTTVDYLSSQKIIENMELISKSLSRSYSKKIKSRILKTKKKNSI